MQGLFEQARASLDLIAGFVLAAAVIATVSTRFVQFRGSVRGAKRRGGVHGPHDEPGGGILLAASGIGSILAGHLVIELAGPGALVWMWIASLFTMALLFAEAVGGARADGAEPRRPWGEQAKGLGRAFVVLSGLGTLLVAITLGGMLQARTGAQLFTGRSSGSTAWLVPTLAAIALLLVLVARLRRAWIRIGVPIALVAYVVLALMVALRDPMVLELALGDAFNAAFGLGPAAVGFAGGTITTLLGHAVLRSAMATTAGLGAATHVGLVGRPFDVGAVAMVVPWVALGGIATSTALAVLTLQSAPQTVAPGQLVPLERPHSRGLRPSQAVGQTIVLPEDTPMEPGEFYALVMRANPRGYAVGRLVPERNAVVLPAWEITKPTATIVFRSRDPRRAEEAAWDVRVPMKRKLGEGPGGLPWLELTPEDPEVDLEKLSNYYELDPKPYVVLGDFVFTAGVARADNPEIGEHLAAFEAPDVDRPFNPKLHEIVRLGYRGPYAAKGDHRPPWGLVAEETFHADPGARVSMLLRADPRGEPVVRINRVGGAEAPAWDILMGVRSLVVRHRSDPALDRVLAVTPRLDGYRIRFDPEDEAWKDFRKIESMAEYEGLYALVGEQRFVAEVHGDARLPEDLAGRQTLVPLHELSEPQGPFGELPYAPHPGELLAAGWGPPVLDLEGAASMSAAVKDTHPTGAWILAIVGLVLALAGIAAWAEIGAGAAAGIVGQFGGQSSGALGGHLGRLAVLVGAAVAGLPAWSTMLGWTDLAMIVALVGSVLAVLWGLASVRSATESDTQSK